MRLIKYDGPEIRYDIYDVSMTDLANIQLALISIGESELKPDEDWHASLAKKAMPTAKPPLTIEQAGVLADLLHGVERCLKMRYYPFGSRDADHPLEVSLRAFTHNGGGIYFDGDIRDAYVWTSGLMERWFKVSDLITALDNIDGKHGLDNPIAIIDKE